MSTDRVHDVVVIGAGPGGSTLAAFLARRGIDVGLLEKENFPRFKIGESLLPYSCDVLRKSGVFPRIDSGKFIRKYGAQFIDHRQPGEVYFEFQYGLDEEHPYSFEVPRADFDNELLLHAVDSGAKLYQPESVERVLEHSDHVELRTNLGVVRAKYIADATGRAALIGKQLDMRQRNIGFNNVAVFSHFEHVRRTEGKRAGDIVIGILPNKCWSWMIPFIGPITSAGVVVDAQEYRGCKYDEDFLRERFASHPLIHQIMSDAKCVRPIQTASNYSETCDQMIGPRWILVGDAATFLDPVFSTGVHISLQSAEFAHEVLVEALSSERTIPETAKGAGYKDRVTLGVKRLRSLLRMFYDTDFVPSMQKAMNRKEVMKSFTSVVGGDAWNESNELFRMGIL